MKNRLNSAPWVKSTLILAAALFSEIALAGLPTVPGPISNAPGPGILMLVAAGVVGAVVVARLRK
jgi:hypothetical protein